MANELEPILKFETAEMWRRVERSWEGTVVVNHDKTLSPNDLNIIVVLCPLYKPGTLRSAGLIEYPAVIDDSRVAGKVKGYLAVVEAIAKYVNEYGGKANLKAVLANKGVLLGGRPVTEADQVALSYHAQLYRETLGNFCDKHNMNFVWSDYEEMGVSGDTFTDPEAALPTNSFTNYDPNPVELIQLLNSTMNLPSEVPSNKVTRKRAKEVMKVMGAAAAYWLISGYLTFDHRIPSLVGDNGVYLSAERMASLWGTADMTESLKLIPRVQIPA